MKQHGTILMLSLLFITGYFTSCNELTEEEAPMIQFSGGKYIDQDVSVGPGDVIRFKWLVTKGSSSLKSFTAEIDGITIPGFPVVNIPPDHYEDSMTLEAPGLTDTYIYEFTVTDNEDLTASESFAITVEPKAGPINTFSVTLGSYGSDKGSSFASTTGTVYQIGDAKANSGLIDILYYYGDVNMAALAAPDDTDAENIFTGTSGLSTWTSRNSTKFKVTSLTTTEFDAIVNDLLIVVNASGAQASSEHHLQTGDIVGFVTDTDKSGGSMMGLIKVVSITTGASGEMQIVVKVQQ